MVKVRKELRSWLKDMISQVGITSIFVTHDQEEAIEVADQIIVTNRGCVEQSGTPREIYREPATPFVAQFLGQSQQVGDISAFAGYKGETGDAILRPEEILLFSMDEAAPVKAFDTAVVTKAAFRGNHTEVEVRLPWGLTLTTTILPDGLPLQQGDAVGVSVKEAYVFRDGAGRRVKRNDM